MSRKDRIIIWTMAVLALAAGIVSAVSLYQHTLIHYGLQEGKSFCNISARINCDAVNMSKWSAIFGIPIASYGIAFYLALLSFILLALAPALIPIHVSAAVIKMLAFFAVLFSAYLFFVSEAVIGSLCILCAGLYLINFGLLFLAVKLSSPYSFFRGVWFGLRHLFALPGLIWNIGGAAENAGTSLARAGLVAIILTCYFGLSLPDFLFLRFIVKRAQQQELDHTAARAVAEWKEAPRIDIETVTGSALNRDYDNGPSSAKIQVIEFSDFECPFCRKFYAEFEDLLETYKNQVHFVLKNFPLDNACNPMIDRQFHRNSCYAAALTRCAGEQDKYWPVVDFLFRVDVLESKESVESIRAEIENGVGSLGLDLAAVKECLQSGRQIDKIKADIQQANALGVQGTPTVWINGKKLNAVSIDALRLVFDEILQSER